MKAVIIGNTNLGYSWFVLTFTQGLMLNGVDVRHIDYKSTPLQQIKKKLLNFKPDIIFTHLSFHQHIHPTDRVLNFFKDIKKHIDVKVVHSCNDARTHDRYMGDLRGIFDIALVGSYPLVKNCTEAFKIPVNFCSYSSLTYDKMANFAPDLAFKQPVFTGSPGAHRTGWADNRAGFIEALQKVMPIKIFKTQSGKDLRKRTPELSVSAECILGLCVGYEIPGYMDVRPFQYLGTGAFMIMRKFNDMDNYIPDDLYVSFENYDDPLYVKELWDRYRGKDTSEMRNNAFNYIQHHHSSKVRMKSVLNLINQL
jgi:spore maturation protein CgeB